MALLLRDLDLDLALWEWCVRWTSSHTCGEWGIATAAPISSIRSKAPENNYQYNHEVMDLQLINQIAIFVVNREIFYVIIFGQTTLYHIIVNIAHIFQQL